MKKTATETWEEFNGLVSIVNEQAEDDAIWFLPEKATEAYLQRKIRELHAQVERMHAALESQFSVKQ